MLINNKINQLKHAIANQIDTSEAHWQLMPMQRKLDFEKLVPNFHTKKSAVLLLFYPENDKLNLIFIKRQDYDGVHSGQIAFPGGKIDKDDKNLKYTALRETNEEIGIKINDIEILGELSEIYIPPSNYLVKPYIGFINYKPEFILNEREVNLVFAIDISVINSATIIYENEIIINKTLKIKAPCFNLNGYMVWGATSMILNELVIKLKTTTI
jgi:8-oxo-dGTP pyrophosphatase MutT (NUDIX family)